MQSPQEVPIDNPRENRITAWGATAWSMGVVFGVFSGGAFLLSEFFHHFPYSVVIIFFLTAVLALLWLSLVWHLRPHRSWTAGRQILWGSVFAVVTGILLSSSLPWYFQWVLHFDH